MSLRYIGRHIGGPSLQNKILTNPGAADILWLSKYKVRNEENKNYVRKDERDHSRTIEL